MLTRETQCQAISVKGCGWHGPGGRRDWGDLRILRGMRRPGKERSGSLTCSVAAVGRRRHTGSRSFLAVQNLPRFRTGPRDVTVVPDPSKSCEKLNRDIEYIVGAVVSGFVLLGKKSIPNGVNFRRETAGRFKMLDTLVGVVENRPALNAVCPRARVASHHGFVGIASNQ